MSKPYPEIEKRYEYLLCLRANGGRMTAAALAETMDKTVVTIWQTFGELQKEGLLERVKRGRGAYIIQVTDAGYAWEEAERAEVDLLPCGHLRPHTSYRLPFPCLPCHNEQRRNALEGNTRYYIPTMSQVMGR